MICEEFKILPWDKRYAVTISGRIISRARDSRWREVKLCIGNGQKRYLSAFVGIPGKRSLVHRLVAEMFIGKSDLEVRHLDGNYKNNHLSNLAYGTRRQNMQDAVKHGKTARGVRNPANKFSEEMIRKIRQFEGSYREIASKFDISYEHARQIKLRLRWQWLE